ncbi:MAG: hypothetical protein EBZ51_01265 [Synechococcaceae bacterium WB9_2_112]|nr:hypothetical protein [Synechococcaceae bacterium WB9_2_112]
MATLADLPRLRRALLLRPGDVNRWQELVGLITALGGELLLRDLDGLFEQPLIAPAALTSEPPRESRDTLLVEQALEAHRGGDAAGLEQAINQLSALQPAHTWLHALRGLAAEMARSDSYAEFARALEREPANPWFRYWKSVAALRRRDWLDFSFEALLLHDSEIIQHQALVLAAVHHLSAAAIARLAPAQSQASDLRVFDLIHPDRISRNTEELGRFSLRFLNKERRKMLRILLSLLTDPTATSRGGGDSLVVHPLLDLLRWRLIGLAEPALSSCLYGACLDRLKSLPWQPRPETSLLGLLPQRPDLRFDTRRLEIWHGFRLELGGPV